MKKFLCTFLLVQSFYQAIPPLQAAPEKLTLCIACHGQQGISFNPEWPNLAGQHASYLTKQLVDFKKNLTRHNASMTAIAAMLEEEDIKVLASFYANQPASAPGKAIAKYNARGEQLYRSGDLNKHIPACIACHGPHGTGNLAAKFPALAGQHAVYTMLQLQAFKAKKRTNDLNSIMRDISAQMDVEDMRAVAYYIQSLH